MITARGIEGGAVYTLAAPIRDALAEGRDATLHIDLRPDLALDEIARRLAAPRKKQSLASFLRKTLALAPAAIALLHETKGAGFPAEPAALARRIKSVPLRLAAPFPIERAISSAGGITFAEFDDALMLRKLPGVFAAGEMLDWEAPTGGYLLQACFATGRSAAAGALHWLGRQQAD
jgi:predicted flavoprotein YhiN